ncbi:MAG: SLBB domain-containing protein [Prevotella sp.]|nr:SLBB domain-containing protein [Prevotella sp.]
MKKFLFATTLCLITTLSIHAQMSDQQVIEFIAREQKAGSSQSQIVTKLMQKGVKIEQIRRLRNQYSKQINKSGLSSKADAAVSDVESRMRQAEGKKQEVTTAKSGTESETNNEADVTYAEVQGNIKQAESEASQIKNVFGRNIFNNRLLSFEPSMNIATPPNYVLGPGDHIIIDIYGASQKAVTAQVSPEGKVTLPGVGPVKVSGMTVAAAQAQISKTLGSRYSSSQLSVSLGQTRSITINVMGEVKVPGTYTLSAFSTVFHALYMAGGINDIGTLRNIKVFRNGRQITVVDVYEYILNGRLAGNIHLMENDVIVVGPYDCLVGIEGNVKRPMFYEMRPTESVGTVLKYAGGFTGDAYKKAVRLMRKTGDRFTVHNVEEFDMNTFKLNDGDAISVDGILNRFDNMVEIKGAVFRPGKFQLGKNITSVRSLIEAADGVTEDAFTAHAVLHRMRLNRTLEVISVDVAGILSGSVADIPLQNEDVLFIPTESDRMNERTLTIQGEVISPGTYEYAENTTIEDLVLQAGGLTDAASTTKVDVSRRILDPKAKEGSSAISKTYTFELKDGFVIDGQPGFILEPYDIVQVRRSPTYMEPRNIFIEGEVQFGGVITLSTKNQRLSDAIKAAGGFTEEAYVKGARLVRTVTEDERNRAEDLMRQIKNTGDQKDSIQTSQLNLFKTYTVGINLDKAIENPGGDYDLVLRDGDRIIVPEYNGTVKISGNVQFPNTVAFNEKKGYKWYINKAGGFGNRAKKSKTFIIYQNGTMAEVGRNTKVEPGCEIVVPTKAKRDLSVISQWLSIGSSITGLAAMIATIANMTK